MQDKAWVDSDELDRLFDEGEVDILQYFDTDNVQYPGLEGRTVAVDLPDGVFDVLERESGKTGMPIQDLIKTWIEERAALVSA